MLRDRPALILGAQPVRLRHANIVEKNLVEFVIARERADRLDRYARRLHVEQQKADPRLRLALVRGADEREHAVREMRARRPYLRSIEAIISRKSVVEGKSVSDRVDPGGRRIIKKKNE